MLYDQNYSDAQGSSDEIGSAAPAPVETRAQWLEREVLPHQAAARQMLGRLYPTLDKNEVLQATYLRLMAVDQVSHIKNGKWYFFMTMHSVVRDGARRNQVVEFESVDFSEVEWAADEPAIEDVIDSWRAMEKFNVAMSDLPERQRTIIQLRRIDGLGARATAERLNLSLSSIEKLQLRAMRRLGKAMAVSGVRHAG